MLARNMSHVIAEPIHSEIKSDDLKRESLLIFEGK